MKHTLAAIGTLPRIGGFALAGAYVYPAETAAAVRAAWSALPDTVGVVVLTEAAADALKDVRPAPARLTIVMPP